MNRQKNNRKKKMVIPPGAKKKFHGFRFLTLIMAILVGFELVCGGVGLLAIDTLLESEPTLDLADFQTNQSTLVYDMNGNEIADVGTQLRENITYDQIPEAMVDAFLSIEDSRYFTHNGFDIPRFIKSMIDTVLTHNVSGGSTFTMQLVKLTYFQNDDTGLSKTRNIEYKIQQIDLAIQLEKQSSKKEIFETYLNKMNFGGVGNIRGVQKAAEQYFGKTVSELNISECALLAGIINSPYYYDPHNYLDHATDRRNNVLYLMNRHGYINDEEYALARSIRVEDLLIDQYSTLDSNGYRYQAYIDEALKEAEQITGQDPFNVSMKIYTAMNPTVQETIENIEQGGNPNISFVNDLEEIGTITMNNQTGEVIAIGGGRSYSGGSMLLNHATEQYKQPGSTVKPFLDYAPAFDYLGWSTGHMISDKPLTYGNWTFQNAYGAVVGVVDLTYAIVNSLNTPAMRAMQAVIDANGYEWYQKYMRSLGFDESVVDNFNISYAIGGNDFVCTVEQLAAAHATEMNGGKYITPHTITKIEYRNGNQQPIEPKYEPVQVMSEAAAYLASELMYQAVHTTTNNFLQVLIRGYATYGKTGTTDWGDSGLEYGIPQGAMKDKWMVCSDTMYTSAIWAGWEKAVAGENTYFSYFVNETGYILSAVLDACHADGSVPATLQRPDSVKSISFIKGSWPYMAVPEGREDLATTGLIKSDFAKLKSFSADKPTLKNLSSFNASFNESDNTISIRWAAYPDKTETTTINKDSNDMNFFDPAGLYGNIVYKARIRQNGTVLKEVSNGSETMSAAVEGLTYDSDIEVCGFYGFEKSDDASNEMCVAFRTPEDPHKKEPEPPVEPETPSNGENSSGNTDPSTSTTPASGQ
ncbi:MAG: transglycosylase domain-containing protein [Bulleidia sp.]